VLAQHFVALYSRQMEKPLRGFAPEVMRTFMAHEWRGNVRELEKLVKRMVVLADDGDALGMGLLPPELQDVKASAPPPVAASRGERESAARDLPAASRTLRSNVSELERQLIADALARHRGNKARVARELGVSYPTLLSRTFTHRDIYPADMGCLDALDAPLPERVCGIGEQRDRLEQVVGHDRHHDVQLELPGLDRERHGHVVAHHLERDHAEHLRDDRVHLARHDAASRLHRRKRYLREAREGARRQQAQVPGNPRQLERQVAQGAARPGHDLLALPQS